MYIGKKVKKLNCIFYVIHGENDATHKIDVLERDLDCLVDTATRELDIAIQRQRQILFVGFVDFHRNRPADCTIRR